MFNFFLTLIKLVANKRRQGTGRSHAPGPVHFRRLWLRHFRDCDEDQCLRAKLIISEFYSSLAIHLTLIHIYIIECLLSCTTYHTVELQRLHNVLLLITGYYKKTV